MMEYFVYLGDLGWKNKVNLPQYTISEERIFSISEYQNQLVVHITNEEAVFLQLKYEYEIFKQSDKLFIGTIDSFSEEMARLNELRPPQQ